MKIYAVGSRDSHYEIQYGPYFSSEEFAQEFLDKTTEDGYDFWDEIYEYELDKFVPYMKGHFKFFYLEFEITNDSYNLKNITEDADIQDYWGRDYFSTDSYDVGLFAKDKDEAIKIAEFNLKIKLKEQLEKRLGEK